MRPVGLAIAIALAVGGPAVAAPADRPLVAELHLMTIEASQTAQPAPGSIAELYPPDARTAGVQGSVLLRCAVAPGGRFNACKVLDERPTDQGFGDAAVRAAARVQQKVVGPHGGERTDGDAYLPFAFAIKEHQATHLDPGQLVWLSIPSGQDMARVYPEAAVRAGKDGRALIGCEVTPEGRLTGCRVLDESPHDWGFGAAALALTDKFQMKGVQAVGGSGGHVRIPIIFQLPR